MATPSTQSSVRDSRPAPGPAAVRSAPATAIGCASRGGSVAATSRAAPLGSIRTLV